MSKINGSTWEFCAKNSKEEIENRKEVYPPFRRNPEPFGSVAPEATRDKGNHW
jgi:hypothetical protein